MLCHERFRYLSHRKTPHFFPEIKSYSQSPTGFECFVISYRLECITARQYVKRREADCGLRIADCGFIDSENPAFIVSPLA
jgi:hypothetical protein